MKRKKARTFIIDEWGRIEDLEAKAVYCSTFARKYAGREVFIGEYPEILRMDIKSYLAFNLDGSFFMEFNRLEMTDADIELAQNDKKFKKEFEKYRKLTEDIEKLQSEQCKTGERSEVIVKSDINA